MTLEEIVLIVEEIVAPLMWMGVTIYVAKIIRDAFRSAREEEVARLFEARKRTRKLMGKERHGKS